MGADINNKKEHASRESSGHVGDYFTAKIVDVTVDNDRAWSSAPWFRLSDRRWDAHGPAGGQGEANRRPVFAAFRPCRT